MMNIKILTAIVLSLSLILLIQLVFLPVVLSIIFVICILCLWLSLKRQRVFAKKWTMLLTVAALLAIYFSYGSFIGIEAGVAVLSTFLFAKALETKNKRDLIVLFNFALFVAASSFLFSQSFFMAVGVVLCLLSCLLGLYRIQMSDFEQAQDVKSSIQQDAKHVGKFVLYAVPFFILLFMFFPRLPPLWHIPIPDNKGVTGISDTMSPGDIAELSQSSALAFRIIGDMTQLPPRSQLYWRALVLDEYDGQTWKSSFLNQQPLNMSNVDLSNTQQTWDYAYLAADPAVLWVMSLEKSVAIEPRYYNRQDWGVVPRRLTQRVEPIQLRWVGQNVKEQLSHSNLLQRINTKTITEYDLKAQALATTLFQQAEQDPKRYMQMVLDWYKQNNFSYTLTPGLLGQHRVDEFLFSTKQGFCEHYASSFVMLMRYVGIPARVVVGYQGGQMAPDAESWEVRQLDAHAWAEVLFDGVWQRVDPTAMIAPQRIDAGMQNLLNDNSEVFGDQSALSKHRFNLMNKLRIWSDYASYQWQRKVIGYDAEAQRSWMSKLGLHSTYSAILVMLILIITLVAAYMLWHTLKSRAQFSTFERVLQQFNQGLPQELRQAEYETVNAWLSRLSMEVKSEKRIMFEKAIQIFEKNHYAQSVASIEDVNKFKDLVKECSLELKAQRKNLS